jgi:hypothetical protein
MAPDLLAALATIALICMAAGVVGWRVGRRFVGLRFPIFAVMLLFVAWYAASWNGRLENVLVFPLAPAILLSNLTPVISCFLLGLGWELPNVPRTRRVIVLGSLAGISIALFLAPLIRPMIRPAVASELGIWKDGVCIQTHDATCGAAAVATMLRAHGMMVTERELVSQCLTSSEGTEPLAVYRTLKIYADDLGHMPKLAAKDPQMWQRLGQYPVLAMVSPANTAVADPVSTGRLRKLLGRSSEGHAVVILGRNSDGDFVVGDPSNGRVNWSPRQMTSFFSGQAIYLEQTRR